MLQHALYSETELHFDQHIEPQSDPMSFPKLGFCCDEIVTEMPENIPENATICEEGVV